MNRKNQQCFMKFRLFLTLVLSFMLITQPAFAFGLTQGSTQSNITRLWGADRYVTARAIAEHSYPGKVENVILSSGNNFPDALAASVIAFKLNAPILLVDDTVEGSTEAFGYIQEHLSNNGTIILTGGTGVINPEFTSYLKSLGYNNVTQIGGQDRYETAELLAEKLNSTQGTPVILTSGEDFPEALSVSSFAANREWPMLLLGRDYLPEKVKNFLLQIKPSKIVLVGNLNSISETTETELRDLNLTTSVIRIEGKDSFETQKAILEYFAPSPDQIYLASGTVFADALTGSVLAARTASPIILLDNSYTSPPVTLQSYLRKLKQPHVGIFGGTGAISDDVLKSVQSILGGEDSTNTPKLNAEDINRIYGNSVVLIETYDSAQNPLALGSGFLTKEGKVVTNYHVIKGASLVKATVAGQSYTVNELSNYDETRDVAVFSITAKTNSAPDIGNSEEVVAGEEIVVIGAPEGFTNTVSTGIVSSASRIVNNQEWIQITAPVSPGSSGGPVFDEQGKVIGIVTWGVVAEGAQNLNFIVPSNELKPLLATNHNVKLTNLFDNEGSASNSSPSPPTNPGNSPSTQTKSDAEFAVYLNQNYGTLEIDGKKMRFTWRVNDIKLGQDVTISGLINPNDFIYWLELLLSGKGSEIQAFFAQINKEILTNYPGKTFWGSVIYQDYYSFYPSSYDPSEISYNPFRDAWLVTHTIVSFYDFRFFGESRPTVDIK